MAKNIVIISGSPKKNGNTASLIEWFSKGAAGNGANIEVVWAAFLKYKANGCTSCRACQKIKEYKCVINDDASIVLDKISKADVVVMATPLYFFGASAQIKLIFDRFFSLYKWDNAAGTMETPLKGKDMVLMASAYEDIGLDALEAPFKITADYTGMKFWSLLIPNAGVSGEIVKKEGVREKAISLGSAVSLL